MSIDTRQSHIIYISVGSNVDKQKHTKAGLQGMYQAFGELTLSSVFESESVGFEGNNFYNLVIKANTMLSIAQVCSVLKQIEQDNKRQRSERKFAPRTLDLDLLLYDNQAMSQPIELPRPEVLYNAFVLKPLAEIAADEIHPIMKQSYANLWQTYDKSLQKLWAIKFDWSPIDT
ncbi:2-amino-4-hydroxy-6-hydroxymethyldihydropteridine diphosphokinase [Paraglaciecola psychrophila]|uniref:2-amino-4-hydroxy-6-hydroxymethyldihydropteridine diphosphokinase n=1 Tax=Paraglaciecola psychrophila 170 TaxID=1129794 RepID=K7AUF4_9ALTE|nr:2-amino-4-hydroxy-6-hydroxymethyldihydropteridine diphosphokinase [Paraglaciecola psychrophila]AGH43120.1 2-amino-4-hydroxy-6- hydroxymethyldihydropteridine pyrophosphokinase [Paraglaciecola psychrophila 170]GAC38805.1 2-amino-4-hydroxy-6-hydroxymethyldihydropteridine diphosphokinase [Paraglaciecola psychrophila 170]